VLGDRCPRPSRPRAEFGTGRAVTKSPARAIRRAGLFLEGPLALQALESYTSSGQYTGAWFECAGRPSDPATGAPVDPSPSRFSIEDLTSLALLDVSLQPKTMLGLLERNTEIASLLGRIDPSMSLADAPDPRDESEGPWVPASQLWKLLRSVPQVGRTRASKLMARKRPHLIPAFDRHIAEGLKLTKHDNDWLIVQEVVRAHAQRLAELHFELQADHPGEGRLRGLSQLRILDIVIWMRCHGAGQSDPDLLLELHSDA
jgi:hypothetical protein